MIEISSAVLTAAVMTLILIQFLGMEMASNNGNPRAYYVMSTIPGLMFASLILLYGPQLIGG